MPRGPRLSWPGALLHVWARGNNKSDIFFDDGDRHAFLARLGRLLAEGGTRCLAWALMTNHFHLLIVIGAMAVSTLMRRLNGGHAVYINGRHGRIGHLFQRRFGSRVVESEAYLYKVLPYILLNPVRSPLVASIDDLATYPWTAYAALMGNAVPGFLDVEGVLREFGDTVEQARCNLTNHLHRELLDDPDGLLPATDDTSSIVLTHRHQEELCARGVQGLLGEQGFLDQVTREVDQRSRLRAKLSTRGWGVDSVIRLSATCVSADERSVRHGRRTRAETRARALAAFVLCEYLGAPQPLVARSLGVSTWAVRGCIERGKGIAKELGVRPEALLRL